MESSIFLLLAVILGLLAGLFSGLRIASSQTRREAAAALEAERKLREQAELSQRDQLAAAQADSARLRAELQASAALPGQLAAAQTLAAECEKAIASLTLDRDSLRQQHDAKTASETAQARRISQLEAELNNERKNLAEKLALLESAKQTLANQFQALAGEILDKKAKDFSEKNQQELGSLLTPLRDQLKDFREKVEKTHVDSQTGVTRLETLVGTLSGLNQQLATEAHNLSTALRGSSKAQGDWGEFILRDLLEKAGMREGEQFTFQETFSAEAAEDGSRGKAARTDVIVSLPGGRHLVIDSKVSLVAYTDYANAETEEQRKSALKLHLASVRAHLDGLSKRKYHKLSGLESPDFVVMFIPVEPAFLLAMQQGGDLWREAYQHNVLLVGPTTLLFVIRIVDNLWQQEQQAKSVADIVDRGTKLYEKFVGFVDDLQAVGKNLRGADQSYQSAMGKLAEGPGNLVRQTEMLKQLGIRTSKQLPQKLLDAAGLDLPDTDQPLLSLAAEAEENEPR